MTTASPWERAKRALVGRPLRTKHLERQLLPKRLALPVFCSDPISSVAYATEQIIMALTLGGLALLHVTGWIALAIVAMLIIIIVSYRQTCYAYPGGGGAYVVSRENLGVNASLVAAAALLVDYVLTVAVSVAAGVDAITSYAPGLERWSAPLSVACVALLTLVNLRGTRESGRGFAVPSYAFIASVYLMFLVAAWRLLTGEHPRAISADFTIEPLYQPVGFIAVFLVLRAFASGCTALTGVEAVSNGVPAFRRPKSRNAANTLAIMGALSVTMFSGITVLALLTHVRMTDPDHPGRLAGMPAGYVEPTALAQIGDAVLGRGVLYAFLQASTAAILIMAANTAYNGFPMLASILSADSYLSSQLHKRGDRLVFSNGILLLATAAAVLLVVFDANSSRLIQLYIIGVFISFTLSQAGMVRHWQRTGPRSPGVRRRQAVNATGATVTAAVLVIVLVTKFANGAWLVCLAIPGLFALMKGIRRHYDQVRAATTPDTPVEQPGGAHAMVLVSRLGSPALQAVAYAAATRPAGLEAVHACTDEEATRELREGWEHYAPSSVPLRMIEAPYRTAVGPILRHVRDRLARHPDQIVTVYIVDYVTGRWWEPALHNRLTARLRDRLLLLPGVMVTLVPYRLASGEGRAERPPRLPTRLAVLARQPDGDDDRVDAATPRP
ncbi:MULTISPECIES: APC family permease [unclassified Nonomuraea]|uniref:APC family permease n=1 Tax=unclassified Nonomuraea TaxID=2593643 RepID=UPI0033FB01AB